MSDSKPERVLCNPADVVEFVCKGLGDRVEEYQPCLSLGIYYKGLFGGVLIHDLRPEIDCYLTIYTTSKRWATKSVLKYVVVIIFNLMKCRRCSVLVSKANSKSLKMCEKLGFKVEGSLRQYRDDVDDCYCLGMLKSECKWNE